MGIPQKIPTPAKTMREHDFDGWFAMQDPQIVTGKEAPQQRSRKKKALSQVASASQMKEVPKHSLKTQKGSKKNLKNEITPPFHHSDRSTSDSFPDSSGLSDEYRALRRKYLLLEEESFSLGKELGDVEIEVKTLEDEKYALLDQLVVLEGLIDPSELQAKVGL
ncbi:uncharacterized protein LOC120267934 isoform X2 [Dioscorea cayenensis subsp. rotundata]|uniref:Uncharacterized protein LOC120267934 isoform X2 n=1 Tax=Dioscorea cayennensis subsp. rotundata TaxID=55577 RepID=A0AB40BX90_DIOCR|nr:uncharacterized protein LOC120267934 isoform X2 [Dioscorea cayenensis subsp. rotundata]